MARPHQGHTQQWKEQAIDTATTWVKLSGIGLKEQATDTETTWVKLGGIALKERRQSHSLHPVRFQTQEGKTDCGGEDWCLPGECGGESVNIARVSPLG